MAVEQFKITWLDSGREPQCIADPEFPNGKDVDIAAAMCRDGHPRCNSKLAYPAKRIGTYVITCALCESSVAVTTAGRPDDPRSVTMPCKVRHQSDGSLKRSDVPASGI